MADIFVSYSSQDRPRAGQLATALEAAGFSVWWDRKLPTGEAFDDELSRQIDAARAIVVLWSPHSVKSQWVRDEASEGLARKALFPVMLDQARLPFGYRRIQTAALTSWQPGQPHAEFDQLVTSLRRRLDGKGAHGQEVEHPAPSAQRPGWLVDRWRRSVGFRLGLLVVPAAVMAIGAVVMMNVRLPLRVQMDLPVRKVTFTHAGGPALAVLDLPAFNTLSVEHFRAVLFFPAQLRAAQAALLESEAGAPSAWRELPVPAAGVALQGGDDALQPSLHIERLDQASGTAGQLDALRLDPGSRITLERRGARPGVLVKIDGQALEPAVVAHGALRLDTVNVPPAGGGEPVPMVYEVHLRASSPEMRILSQPTALALKLGWSGQGVVSLIPAGGVAISDIVLIDMPVEDRWSSTLVGDARMTFPEHPGIAAASVSKDAFIGVSGLERATLTQMILDPKGEGMTLRLDGRVRSLDARTGDYTRDLRPTMLELYRASANGVFLLSFFLGVASATWSVFLALRELRGRTH